MARKNWGFYKRRRREKRREKRRSRRRLSSPRWLWVLALAGLLLLAGMTRAWPRDSGSLSNSSNGDLTTWETLSGQFQEALKTQSERLRQALTELETSKASSETLTGLLERSSQANDGLRNYNEQIAERMRERDEDLAAAYTDSERLEKNALRHWIILRWAR